VLVKRESHREGHTHTYLQRDLGDETQHLMGLYEIYLVSNDYNNVHVGELWYGRCGGCYNFKSKLEAYVMYLKILNVL
jgi:hypothetical protein